MGPTFIFILLIMAFGIYMTQRYSSGAQIRWMLVGYIAILFLSAGFYTLFPIGSGTALEIGSEQAVDQDQNLFHEVTQGKIEKIDPALIVKKWEKNYQHKQLKITTANDGHSDVLIVVERKAENDGRIEGILYKTRSIVGGVEITQAVHPIQIEWSEDTLTVLPPKPVDLNLAIADQAFTITQFVDRNSGNGRFRFHVGRQFLYLRIPADIKIVKDDYVNIFYVQQD